MKDRSKSTMKAQPRRRADRGGDEGSQPGDLFGVRVLSSYERERLKISFITREKGRERG